MIVQPFASLDENKPMPVLRSEPISRDVYIALFAGSSQMVHIREPHEGVRFGVEPKDPTASVPEYEVDRRNQAGESLESSVPVKLRNGRVLNVEDLASRVGNAPRLMALHLEQPLYVQEFK